MVGEGELSGLSGLSDDVAGVATRTQACTKLFCDCTRQRRWKRQSVQCERKFNPFMRRLCTGVARD